MLNLDTHLIVYFLDGTCTDREYDLISKQEVGISSIVRWELAKLTAQGRVGLLNLEAPEFRGFLRQMTVIPISLDIAITSTLLDFSSDLADEIIAATSVVERLPLLTRDRQILRSRVVPLA